MRGIFRLILPCPDQSSNQKQNDSPDPSRGRKKGRIAWKMGRREDKNAESPLLWVCQSCQSSVCPYSSLDTDVTSSPVGWSIRLTHLDNRAVLVCISCRTPKPPRSTGYGKSNLLLVCTIYTNSNALYWAQII